MGALIQWFVKQANVGREQAKLEAQVRHNREQAYYRLGREYVDSLTICPQCKQEPKDAVINSHYECMDIVLDYCDHAVHYREYLDKPAFTEMYDKTWAKVYKLGTWIWTQQHTKK